MIGVKPYVSFPGTCEEAMDFYKNCLGGEIVGMQRYGESPMAGEGNQDKIIHSVLRLGDTFIMAADNISPGRSTTQGDNISLAIGIDDVTAADEMFGKMSEGGTVTMPMQETYWASRFGMLVDKFGISWMFNCEKPRGGNAENI